MHKRKFRLDGSEVYGIYKICGCIALIIYLFRFFDPKEIVEMIVSAYLYWAIVLLVIIALPFALFAYIGWSRRQRREGDSEMDARLHDALAKSQGKH